MIKSLNGQCLTSYNPTYNPGDLNQEFWPETSLHQTAVLVASLHTFENVLGLACQEQLCLLIPQTAKETPGGTVSGMV